MEVISSDQSGFTPVVLAQQFLIKSAGLPRSVALQLAYVVYDKDNQNTIHNREMITQ